jgi:hypothetical protein
MNPVTDELLARGDVDRRLSPLFHPDEVPPPAKASQLQLIRVQPRLCLPFIASWHSRLPYAQKGPWRAAYAVHYGWTCYGVALWNNTSARTLPDDWLELRRMALPDDAPHCAASWMLGAMRRAIRADFPEVRRLVSYQDTDVHQGTIYRAAGWEPAWFTKPRQRDRSGRRKGTERAYRSDANGCEPSAAGKVRWEIEP